MLALGWIVSGKDSVSTSRHLLSRKLASRKRIMWRETDWILFCMHGKPYSFPAAANIDAKRVSFPSDECRERTWALLWREVLRIRGEFLQSYLTFSLPVVPAAAVRYSDPDSFAQGLVRYSDRAANFWRQECCCALTALKCSCGVRICRAPTYLSYQY